MYSIEWFEIPKECRATALTWNPHDGFLYWSDPVGAKLYRLNPTAGTSEVCLEDGRPIGAIVAQNDGSLVLFRNKGNVVIWRDGAIVKTIIEQIGPLKRTVFTAATATPNGRIFVTAASDRRFAGRLFSLDFNGYLSLLIDTFVSPTALAFGAAEDGKSPALYLNDSHALRMSTWRFDYDSATGEISNGVIFRNSLLNRDRGTPFGLAVDEEGNVWSTRWGGGELLAIGGDGQIVRREKLPINKPAAITFGGAEGEDIYITSTGGYIPIVEGERAGSIAHIRIPRVRGLKPYLSSFRLPAPPEPAEKSAATEETAAPEVAPPAAEKSAAMEETVAPEIAPPAAEKSAASSEPDTNTINNETPPIVADAANQDTIQVGRE